VKASGIVDAFNAESIVGHSEIIILTGLPISRITGYMTQLIQVPRNGVVGCLDLGSSSLGRGLAQSETLGLGTNGIEIGKGRKR